MPVFDISKPSCQFFRPHPNGDSLNRPTNADEHGASRLDDHGASRLDDHGASRLDDHGASRLRVPGTILFVAATLALWLGLAAESPAQPPRTKPRPNQESPANASEVPELKRGTIETKDGVILGYRFYPGQNGKQTVPIIVVHDWKEQGGIYERFAMALQSEKYGGHAVLIPDLRGHGESTKTVGGEGQRRPRAISADRFRAADVRNVIQYDLEAAKSFLMEQHREGELNIDTLCVVGAGMGAVAALHWAAMDWDWPMAAGHKQGQDVKALALLSLPNGFKGVTCQDALRHPAIQSDISILFLLGTGDTRLNSSVRRMYKSLKNKRDDEFGVFLMPLETTLQGSKLVEQRQLKVAPRVSQYFNRQVDPTEYKWTERKRLGQ